jgi:hypothetical protein
MSKAEIMAEIHHLSLEERREIMEQLASLEELEVLRGGTPSAEEKALLDQALKEYRRNPGVGRPWRDVLADLRADNSR